MTKEIYKLYNDSLELSFDPTKHIYEVEGKRVEGVTGVVGIIAKPALMYWAVNMAIEHITRNIKPGKSYDEIELKNILEEAKKAHRIKKEDAGDIGSLVHASIDQFIKSGSYIEPIHEQAKVCFQNFHKWVQDNEVVFLESERKVYSKLWEYAGTMDFICTIKGKLFVGDIKTSSAIYDEYFFQTSAYQQAYEEETGKRVEGQVIVRVGKDGSFDTAERNNDDYEENRIAFNGALQLYRRIQKLKDKKKEGEQNE